MIRGVVQCIDGKPRFTSDLEAVRPPTEGFVWIDIQGQTREDLELLGQRFGFHPLALEDCEHLDQRPKIESYGSYLFIVIHGFEPNGGDPTEVQYHELHMFFNDRYLITVHQDPLSPLEALWARSHQEEVLVRRGVDFLLYMVCDVVVDANFPILDQLSEEVEKIEDQLLEEPDPSCLQRLIALKRSLVCMRRILSPQREVFNTLLRADDLFITQQTQLYFRDVYDHLIRLYEIIDTGRDLLGNARDAHFSVLSQRTNEIMKRLTLVSLVFLPLTFLTGFFGMNFEHLPFGNDWLLVASLISMVVLPVSMLLWFKYKRWFS